MAADAVVANKLRIVLPEYPLSAFWLSIFYPTSQRNSLELKLFLGMIAQSFTETPPWDECLIALGLVQPRIVE